jgi:hypothetical protein
MKNITTYKINYNNLEKDNKKDDKKLKIINIDLEKNIKKNYELKPNNIEETVNIDMFNYIWKNKCSKYGYDKQISILPKVNRILVIGDIHGDLNNLLDILKLGKVINNDNNWIGDDTVIVQVGDQIDRCRFNSLDGIPCNIKNPNKSDEGNDYLILNYLTNLHFQALKTGGAVYSLLGNHELMNVEGDMRYVSYEGLNEFNLDSTNLNGYNVRKYLFSPGNPLSEFLACTRQTALIIGSNLFVHAGILPEITNKYKINNINQILTLYLLNILNESDKTKYNELFSFSDSPLWNRIYGKMGIDKYNNKIEENSDLCDQLLHPLKDIYKVDNLFIGHTPLLKNGIGSICNNKIWLTDYGSSSAFDLWDNNSRSETRKAQILEILNDGEYFNVIK